jgi:hypothetical protein
MNTSGEIIIVEDDPEEIEIIKLALANYLTKIKLLLLRIAQKSLTI